MTKSLTSLFVLLLAIGCGAPQDGGPPGSSSNGGSSGTSGGASSGGAVSAGGAISAGGSTGGSPVVTGGAAGTGTGGASGGSAGTGVGNGGTGMIDPITLDCGPVGQAIKTAGPPENRVNFVIVGEGYDAQEIETTFIEHVNGVMERRYEHETGEPFGRYRNFVNICALKSPGTGNVGSPFGGSISGRVSGINNNSVDSFLDENVPMNMEVAWKAVSFNITSWNNVGGETVLFAGGHGDAAGALLHEGGHGHHQLADEYHAGTGANCQNCGEDTNGTGPTGQEYGEINSTGNPMTTGGKWDLWIGATQKGLKVPDMGATGLQSTWSGSRYEGPGEGQYRPTANSMMNSLFGDNLNTSFNAISREQIIYTIWEEMHPIDRTEPPAGAVSGAMTLQVFVVDTAVINVDWSVDGAVVAMNGGTSFNTATLAPGTHTVSAKAYDNATEDLVRYRTGTCPDTVTNRYCHSPGWLNSIETVEWTVTVP